MEDEKFETLDAFIEYLKELEKVPRVLKIDQKRMKEFQDACSVLKGIALEADPDAKIEYEIDSMGAGVGIMRIVTDRFEANDMQRLINGIQFATNVEAYALTDGNIRIAITFYDITNEIKK